MQFKVALSVQVLQNATHASNTDDFTVGLNS